MPVKPGLQARKLASIRDRDLENDGLLPEITWLKRAREAGLITETGCGGGDGELMAQPLRSTGGEGATQSGDIYL